MTASVFTPLSESEIDAALSGAAAELHDITQVQSKNLRLLQAVMRAHLKGSLKNLLWLLCMHYNDSKDCAWPSIERLAMLSLTEARTVQRNLKQLVKAGLVVVGRVPGIRSNAFFIVEEAVQAIAIEGISFAKNQPAPVATKGDIYTPKGDIFSAKGDIFPPKGDASVTLTEGTDVGTEKGNGGGTDARATPPAPAAVPAPVAPATPEPASPPALFASQPPKPEQPTAATTDASAFAHLVDRINAQRASNGKPPFTVADIAMLRAEAVKAGISIEEAAKWILERRGRNFFHAEFLAPPAPAPVAPTAPAQPAPQPAPAPAALTPEQCAEQEAAVASERAKLKSMFAQPASAATPAQAQAADTLVVPNTGHAWADSAIAEALAGQPVSVRRLEMACQVAKVGYSEMRAAQKRAAAALTAIAV